MAQVQKITLCWYAKVGTKWQYFPVILEKKHEQVQVKHGWVLHHGVEVEYPVGRYVLRSYVEGRKVYEPVKSNHPRDAYNALRYAQRAAATAVITRDPRKLIKTATAAYIRDCKAQNHLEAAEQARVVLDEFAPLCVVAGTSCNVPVHWVKDINRGHVLAFHKKLRDRGCSERTVANKDARLRSWLKFCGVNMSFLPDKPTYEETEAEIYTPAEVKTILEAADDYMEIVIGLALKLGLREKEIVYAEWADVDWHHSTFRVQGKTRKDWSFAVKDKAQRLIPIPADMLTTLSERREKRQGTSLIVGNEKGQPEGHLLRKLKQLARRAGLNCGACPGCLKKNECERWFLHKFRATFVTRMLRQSDPVSTMKVAGHSDMATTLRYTAAATGEEMQAHANAIKWTE